MAELTLEEKKRAIWEDVSSSFSMCQVITDFPSQLIHNEDLPRLIYKGKAVLSDNLFEMGSSAELTIINPNQEWVFKEDNIYSKSKNSPFIGETLKGKVHYTLSKGFLADLSVIE